MDEKPKKQPPAEHVDKQCLGCGVTMERRPRPSMQAKHKYCDNFCAAKHRELTVHRPRYEAGDVKEISVGTASHRRWLASIRPYVCECCGLHEWQGAPITLHMDHVDGNRHNNMPDNLRWMCPNCHQQTETWGSRNKAFQQRMQGKM